MASRAPGERDIAIVGVAESDEMGTVPNKSSLQHHAEAAHNALEDAGLSKNDVDGLLTAGFSTLATTLEVAFLSALEVVGCPFQLFLQIVFIDSNPCSRASAVASVVIA